MEAQGGHDVQRFSGHEKRPRVHRTCLRNHGVLRSVFGNVIKKSQLSQLSDFVQSRKYFRFKSYILSKMFVLNAPSQEVLKS